MPRTEPPAHIDIERGRYYRGPELARLFGVSWQSILNTRSEGGDTPPGTKIGGALYFLGEDVLDWLASRREPGRVTTTEEL